ncbi:RagB/SusD family nutrient uptake outer membrane protein [Gelidibacter salicanalis]|uniref:RagB/SusD family nutrient uptake outer membrane protein n=1 Tax=Gelidibacter salicanalis TaxID=291193 RepID=A0A934KLV3_9FLAO|nr:RagB/SusD family nutrient uptake outer membrane protein [Gelidibacter salicanalis]MBJ7881572.1 RagB/SusD family nutrient uptake outer membrane protein [Gelidibacter salicanalis]
MRIIFLNKIMLVVIILTLMSCSDNFLDKQPGDALSSGTFWKTEADAQMALTGIYGQLQTNFLSEITFDKNGGPKLFQAWDEMTDNAYGARDNGFRDLAIGSPNPDGQSKNAIKGLYAVCYVGINSCNEFLENIDKVVVSDNVKNVWIGEVLFIRSYFYYYLAATYGDVPIRLVASTVENQYTAKSSQAEVFAQILTDLNTAIQYLPSATYDGHVKKEAALALKAKILLYTKKYKEAAMAAKEVMDGGQYQLSAKYENLFLEAGQDANPEIIFSIKMTNVPGESPGHSVQTVIGFWGNLHPTRNLVDSYECSDGLSIEESPLYDNTKPTLNRDPRLLATVFEGNWNPLVEIKSKSGFVFSKGITANVMNTLVQPINDGTDFIHIRYADVLLMYAEAKIEDNDIDQTVLDAINKVRARAYGVDYTDVANYPAVISKDPVTLRAKIRNERRVEFPLENSRYFDLKRWGIAEQVLNGFNGDPVSKRVFLPKHYKWPLPQDALDKNPLLEQNPDYK